MDKEMNESETLSVEDRNYVDAKTFFELHGAEELRVMVNDGICPECGEELNLSKGDHTIMVKAECPDCDFGFVDTQKGVDCILDNN